MIYVAIGQREFDILYKIYSFWSVTCRGKLLFYEGIKGRKISTLQRMFYNNIIIAKKKGNLKIHTLLYLVSFLNWNLGGWYSTWPDQTALAQQGMASLQWSVFLIAQIFSILCSLHSTMWCLLYGHHFLCFSILCSSPVPLNWK